MLGLFSPQRTGRAVLCRTRGGLLAALLCLAPDAAAQTTPTANADGSYTIPYHWALKPDGFEEDDRFRLLFLTHTRNPTGRSALGYYDTWVQADAGDAMVAHDDIQTYAAQFRPLISTRMVDARDHTSTTGTGVPIYWVGGAKVADNYADFYDGSWDSIEARHASGETAASGYTLRIWTGSQQDGTARNRREANSITDLVMYGSLRSNANPISELSGHYVNLNPLYAVSPVFVVGEPPELNIAGGAAITEGANASFTVSADAAVPVATTVNLSVADAAGSDFVAEDDEGSQTVTIAAGDASATFTVATEDGSMDEDEADGSITVTVQDGTGYTVGTTSSASVAVTDNDATTVTVEGVAVNLPEGSSLEFSVRLNRELVSGEILPVPLTLGGTATNGSDYSISCESPLPTGVSCAGLGTSAATITFTGPSAKLVDLTVQANNDGFSDGTESLVIGLGTLNTNSGTGLSGGATGVDNLADFNILESFTVSLTFTRESASVNEGQTNPTADFSAYVTGGVVPAGGVVLPFTINVGEPQDGDASTADYGTVPAGISIAAGGFSGTAKVPIVNDSEDELVERIRFGVSKLPPGYQFTTGSFDAVGGTVSIIDNDATEFSLTGGGTITEEATTTTTTMTVRAARRLLSDPRKSSPAETATVPLILATTTGAALPGSTNPLFTVTASGTGVSLTNANTATPTLTFTGHNTDVVQEATVTFTATANGDSDMADETVTATLGTMTSDMHGGVSAGSDNSATLNIADDDSPPELSVAVIGSATVTEGGSATIRVTRAGGNLSAALSFSATETAASGFNDAFSNVTSIPANQTSVNLTYSITNNNTDAPDGAATYALNTHAAYTISSTAGSVTLAAVDNDATPVTLAGAADNVEEGASKTLTVTLGRGLVSGEVLAVPLTFAGTATRGTDYTLSGASGSGLSYQNLNSGSGSVTFTGPSATVATLTLNAATDQADESPETVDIDLVPLNANSGTGLSGGASSTDNLASFSIEDPPGNGVSLSVSNSGAATEGGSALTITATLENANTSGAAISIPIEVRTDGTTAQPADYTVASSISIANNAQSGTTSFTVTDDDLAEDNEAVLIDVGSALPGDVVPGETTAVIITITDDDEVGLVFSRPSLGLAEDASASYTVKLASEPTSTVTVNITGHAGTDLMLDKTSLTFTTSTWNAAQTVTVTDGGDTDTAKDTATLTHTASGGDYDAVEEDLMVTVTDNDTPGLVLSQPALTVAEGSNASYTVKLATEPTGQVTVAITGHAGTDLTLSTASLTFTTATWNTAQTVTVTANSDPDAANDTATLTHTASGGGYLLSATLAVTVTDDDEPAVSFAASTSSAAENAGTQNVTVNLSPAPPADITVSYTVDPSSTADPGTDYTALSGEIAVTAGATSVDIPVVITDDNAFEGDETIILTLTGGSGYTVGTPAGHTLTITDNESPPTIPVASFAASTSNPSESAGTQNVTVNLLPAPTAALTVSYSIGGMATPGADYSISNSGSVTIAANATSATIPVMITDDSEVEGNETIILTLTASTSYTIGTTNSHTLTIQDNEPTVSFAASSSSAVESAGTQNVTVNLSPAPTAALTVSYMESGTATPGDDYTALSRSVQVAATATSVTIPVTITDDSAVEGNETIILTLTGGGTSYTIGTPAVHTLTIQDNDSPPPPPPPPPTTPVVTFASVASSAPESAGTRNLTVNLSPAPQATITVNYSIGGTATTADYTALSGSVSVNATQTSVNIPVTITDDSAVEGNETIILTLTGGNGYTVGSANVHTLIIQDNDSVPTVRLSASSNPVTEGGTVTVTVQLSAALTGNVTIPLTLTAGTAEQGDFSALASITISGGQTSGTGTVATVQDPDEDDETFTIALGALPPEVAPGSPASIQVTIRDRGRQNQPPTPPPVCSPPPPLGVSLADTTVAEGGIAQFVVRLKDPMDHHVCVEYVTVSATAQASQDYTGKEDMINIRRGATTDTIKVLTLDDAERESDETFKVRLLNTPDGEMEATATILDDDDNTPQPPSSVTIADATVVEGDIARFVVRLDTTEAHPVVVDWTTATGTAQLHQDYAYRHGTLLIPAGETTGIIEVPTRTDTEREGDETFKVRLLNAPSELEATATILSAALPRLTLADATVVEGGIARFVVRLAEGPVAGVVPVQWTTVSGTARAGQDYDARRGTLAIPPGETTGLIEVPTRTDAEAEGDERFAVRLFHSDGPIEATGTIRDGGVPDDTTEPAEADETEPAEADETELAEVDATELAEADTTEPVEADETEPAEVDATELAEADETEPGEADETEPGEADETEPGEVDATELAEADETEPGEADETEPGEVDATELAEADTTEPAEVLPQLTIADTTVVEGNPVVLVVSLSAESEQSVTVEWTVAGGTATQNADYIVVSLNDLLAADLPSLTFAELLALSTGGRLTIPAGQTRATLSIQTLQDQQAEGDETLQVMLVNPTQATLAKAIATATILDADNP